MLKRPNLRLTVAQRRLLSQLFLLGAALTVLVVLLEWYGGLTTMERLLYDRRAKDCQYFSPRPSQKIVVAQIDDQTIADVGRWPWPRSKMAAVFEELRLAGAKVIALDILLTEPELPTLIQQSDGSLRQVENDKVLASVFRSSGNVLVPASAGMFAPAEVPPIEQAIFELLIVDAESSSDEVAANLKTRGFADADIKRTIDDEFLALQEQAMLRRLDQLLEKEEVTVDRAVEVLTPKALAKGEISDPRLLAVRAHGRIQAMRKLRRFSNEIPPTAPPLLRGRTQSLLVPVPTLVEEAAYSGFVDFVPSDDAVVRSIPLVGNFGGRLFPHMVLSMACAELGVPTKDIQVYADKIVLPVPNGPQIKVPVRTIEETQYGIVGAFLDLSWFGDDKWENMYDYPHFERAVQQETLKNVWRIEELRTSIESNREKAINALMHLRVDILGENDLETKQKLTTADAEQLREIINKTLEIEDLTAAYAQLKEMKPSEWREEEKLLIASIEALKSILRSNEYLVQRIDESRKSLHEKFEGKLVFVGATSLGLYDFYATSLHPQCPGVVIQSVALNAILTQNFWRIAPEFWAPIITAAMGVIVTLFVAFLPSYRALVATLLLVITYLLINGLWIFDYGNWIVPAAGAITSAVVVWGILTLYRYIYESAERARISKRFSGYVDPAIVNLLLEDPDKVHFDGEVREMTVVFTDLAGFTTISEKLQERTVPLLNDYMSRMMPIIRKNGGTWNKFLGDGIMFFYNAPIDNPNHARDAVETVIQMQKEVELFNVELLKQQLPKVAMRAGIVTGKMIAGDAGSIGENHEASDYTVLGDNVNLAARLESANKALGSRTLVVQDTIDQMGGTFLARPIAKLQVVGKTQGVMTWEPLCLKADATDKEKRLVELTTQVVETFTARKFKECIAATEKLQDEFGSSKFTALYLSQAREFLLGPPDEDWDGTIVLESK